MSTLKEGTPEVEGVLVGQHAGVYEAFDDPSSSAPPLTDNTKENNNDDEEEDAGLSLPPPQSKEQQHAIELHTAPPDPRFTNPNQARRCFVSYCEYHKCIKEEGRVDADRCRSYKQAYHSICPMEWIELWNELREEGRWFGKY